MYDRANEDGGYNCLDLTEPHTIAIASYNFYGEPSLHPDRVMAQHDIFYMLEGSWEVTQDGVSYLLEKDDVIFLFAGRHHWGVRPCSPHAKTLFIHFFPCAGDTFCADADNCADDQACFPVIMHCSNAPLVKKYFETLNCLYWSDEKRREKKMAAYTDLLFCELSSVWAAGGEAKEEMVAGIIREINANLHRFYTIDELAAEFFISRRTLINLFRKHIGASPHAYQVNMKLDICRDLLQNEAGVRIKELAERFGFCDEFHFSRLFKQRFGISPKFARGGIIYDKRG